MPQLSTAVNNMNHDSTMPDRTGLAEPLLKARNISLYRNEKLILDKVSLSVSGGENVTLIGPNGAGKTSLVRILLGLISPTTGTISRAPKLRIGYMPQKLQIDSNLPISVHRFLSLANNSRDSIQHVLQVVDIAHLRDAPLSVVSGGEMQRILLARALLRDPQLLVLDEPVQGVDLAGQTELYQLINRIRAQYHCGVLMVSHDLHLVMASTDTVVCLNQHVCCQGHPETISHDPGYLNLFGDKGSESIAIYTHHHDHEHDLHGNVVDDANQGEG